MSSIDEHIKKAIVDDFYWDTRIDASDIQVIVENRNVILKGTVPNYVQRMEAVLDAWNAANVKSVKNEIQVKRLDVKTVPSDEEIKERIELRLLWNTAIDSDKINLTVNLGIVTLEGTVDAYWKILRIRDIVASVDGVVDIVSKLVVIPMEDILDKDIAQEIVDTIEPRKLVSVDDVDVKVQNGIVVLKGEVPTYSAYTAALDSARYTLGVVDVKNELQIE